MGKSAGGHLQTARVILMKSGGYEIVCDTIPGVLYIDNYHNLANVECWHHQEMRLPLSKAAFKRMCILLDERDRLNLEAEATEYLSGEYIIPSIPY